MKYHIAILVAVVSIVVVMGLQRKRMPEVNTPVSSQHSPSQMHPVISPPEEQVDQNAVVFSNLMPAEVSERRATQNVHQNTNAAETHPYDRVLEKARHDLSPRLIALITNQLARLGPLEEETYDKDDWHKLELAKGKFAQGWGTALLRFAEKNGGKCPETLDQAAQYYPQDRAFLLSIFDKDRFEIMYHGSLHDLADPESVILVRETAPTVVLRLSQHWWKTYVFGNGNSGMKAAFQNIDEFREYENQRLVISERK